MKRIFSASTLLITLTAALLSVTSCIREDMDDCPRHNVRVVVKTYPEVTRAAAIDRYNIGNATIYVFDSNNKYVTAWQGGAYVPGQVYDAWFQLEPGSYHFVVWTNQGPVYTATHTVDDCNAQAPQLEDLTLYMNCPSDRTITDDLPDFHYGTLAGATVIENTQNEFTVVLTPNTYRINITVQGLPVTADRYGFSITDNNSHYTFDNDIVGGRVDFKHYRYTGFGDADELHASMTVLKLTETRTPSFDFSDETIGQSLFSDDLVGMIKRAYGKQSPQMDFRELFATVFDYDITLRYDAVLGVTVLINGWAYSNNETEL